MPDRPGAEGLEPELLDRYLAGECSEQEGAIVRRYLMARPEVASALSALLRQLDGFDRADVGARGVSRHGQSRLA